MAKAAGAAMRAFKFLDDFKTDLNNRDDNKLRNAIADFDGETFVAAVPAGNKQLALVIRINQANQVAQHNAMFMAEARTRQYHSRHIGVFDINCHTGWNQ